MLRERGRQSGRGVVAELRDPVHGPIPVNAGELQIIDAPHFQRLRRIKQLGFGDQVFPGAVHNRYLHSIGAMHVAGRLFDALHSSMPWLDDATAIRFRQTVRVAALLHDIGHPPMSHAAEALLPMHADLGVPGHAPRSGAASHEDMTLKLVLDSQLTDAVRSAFGAEGVEPAHVAALVDKNLDLDAEVFRVDGRDHRPLLTSLVSGELDVDRMDYLLRDSYFAGVMYGRYDLDWILSNTLVVPDGDVVRLAMDIRAVPAFEHFLLARYHMFQMVYFHPKSDIYDAMLRKWMESVGEEARMPADPEAYITCDDAWLLTRLAASDDPWARRIDERRPPVLAAEIRDGVPDDRRTDLEERLASSGIEAIWLTAKPVLSRYGSSPAHLRTNPLLVRDSRSGRSGPQYSRIEEVTDLFDRYDQTLRIERIYVEAEQKVACRGVLADWRAAT
jgi:HD superfamily phosphohydrolase